MTARADEDGIGRAAPRKRLRMALRTRAAYALLFASLAACVSISLVGLALLP